MEQIDYLVIGHLAKDVRDDGFSLGGTVTYAALCAARLGRRVGLVTACGPGIDWQKVLPDSPVARAPSLTSTVFENVYRHGERVQTIHSRAAALGLEQIPSHWRGANLVHLAPIAQEIPSGVLRLEDAFRGSFVGLSLQGWLRGWDETGRVFFKFWADAPAVLPKVSAVVFSEEDVGFREEIMEYFASLAPVAAVTLGRRGAKVHWEGAWHHSPAFAAQEVDSTGAGDVFAAAFFHRLEQTRDPLGSAAFANCAASFAVEDAGTAGIRAHGMVERRLRGEE